MIANIRLQNFRSYRDSSFEFDKKTNIIVGPNASGKTNLLEAVYVMAKGRSFRAKEQDVVNHSSDWGRLDAYIANQTKSIKITNQPSLSKRYVVNEKEYVRLPREFVSPVVLFEPNNLAMLYGPPDARRSYIDEIIEYTTVGYASTLKIYQRSLAQRNRLLKQQKISNDELFVWDVRLSELGEKIYNLRKVLINEINKKISIIYSEIADQDSVVLLSQKTKCNTKQYGSSMLHILSLNREQDILRGFTSAGPHRDDIEVVLNGEVATNTASRGEFRTILLALKVIELQILDNLNIGSPILLLDDVFSELDGKRRHHLTNYVQKYQSFITTTDADILIKNFIGTCNVIAI